MKRESLFIFIYALLILIGGIVGYATAGSLASLASGLLFGGALLLCSYFIRKNHLYAYDVALVTLCLLLTFFCYRFILTHKVAPAGILFLLTTFLLIYLGRKRPAK